MVRNYPSVTLEKRSDIQRNLSGKDWDLLEIHRNIMKDELRVWLLRSLINKNLATRDIYHFSVNQARQRSFKTELDKPTITAAMNIKIEDIKEALNNN